MRTVGYLAIIIVLLSISVILKGNDQTKTVPAASVAPNKLVVAPAPSGDPVAVAQRIIHVRSKDKCPRVLAARRDPDGTIRAMCRNDESFLVFQVNGEDVALRCAGMRELGMMKPGERCF